MTDNFSERLRKSGEEARRKAHSLRAQEQGNRGTPVSQSELMDALAGLQEQFAILAERVEALERDR